MVLSLGGYNRTFFDETQMTSSRSSAEIVPIIMKLLPVNRVIDLGCGTASWLSTFKAQGADYIRGVDNASVENAELQIPRECVLKHDLTKRFELQETFDLATCMEVAEHLPETCARQIVENLTRLAPVVLFSAAIPHQGGTGHINEQWPEYWANLFDEFGYVPVDALREQIWENENVAYWYAQNLIFYVKSDAVESYPELLPYARRTNKERLTNIHPKTFVKNSKQLKNPALRVMRFGWNLMPRTIRLMLIKPLGNFIWNQVGTKY